METKLELNQAFNLGQVAEYADEGVKLCHVMKTQYGSVNILAFKAGQKLDAHLAPADVIIYDIEGMVDFAIGDKVTHLNAGDALLMNAGTVHAVTAITDAKVMLTKIEI